MPDETPNVPTPASGAERLTLSVESVRGAGARASQCYIGACVCFADDDGVGPSGYTIDWEMCFADDAE